MSILKKALICNITFYHKGSIFKCQNNFDINFE